MFPLFKVIVLPLIMNELFVPAQVVVGAGEVAIVKPLGSVSLNVDCVSTKPFALLKVKISEALEFSLTLIGENVCVIVGGSETTSSAVGQAEVPALVGALLDALLEVNVTVAVSVAPILSVTVRVRVPPPGNIVTCEVVLPDTMVTPPLAVQEYVLMVRPHEAALPLASSTA